MKGSHARFTLAEMIKDYLRPGSDEAHGWDVLASGGALNVNVPSERRLLIAAMNATWMLSESVRRDGHLNRRTD